MSILIRGSLREGTTRRSEVALPLSVSFMAADIDHSDEFGANGATLFQVHFLDAEFMEASRTLNGWIWTHGGPAARPFMQLVRSARSGDSELSIQLVCDVLAASKSDAPAHGRPPAWLNDVRELIDDTYGWPRVADLAAIARVHRVYLARQFRRFYGCSVSDYIRRRRVQSAARRMEAANATLSAVAHTCGFHDHAHMCRAFRRECGMSPSAFHRLVGDAASSAHRSLV